MFYISHNNTSNICIHIVPQFFSWSFCSPAHNTLHHIRPNRNSRCYRTLKRKMKFRWLQHLEISVVACICKTENKYKCMLDLYQYHNCYFSLRKANLESLVNFQGKILYILSITYKWLATHWKFSLYIYFLTE